MLCTDMNDRLKGRHVRWGYFIYVYFGCGMFLISGKTSTSKTSSRS